MTILKTHWHIGTRKDTFSWKPSPERTMLYLPLENDVSDHSWNTGRTFATSWISYTTVGWLPSIHVGSTGWIKLTAPYPLQSDITKPLTVSCLFYRTWTWVGNILDFAASNYQWLRCSFDSNWNIWIAPWEFIWSSDYLYASINVPFETSKWNVVTYTVSTTATKLYINWELKWSWNWWRYPRSYWNRSWDNTQWILTTRNAGWDYSIWLNWNARELIIEQVERSERDILKYNARIKNKLWF